MATLTIDAIHKSLGGRKVLKGVSLDVKSNEFFCLLGASGCGKSTLLRLIAGLERPDGGRIVIDGHDVGDLAPARRDVAMIFQSYALYPHMKVVANLALPLEMRRLTWAERAPLLGRLTRRSRDIRKGIDEDVGRTAELLGISGLLGRRPAQLSGGQKQRVAIGRAIIRSPRIFLMDEPLSNLDAGLRAELRREIAALRMRLSATFIYVTHDHTEAMTMADRIGVMADGELLQVGTPAEIYGEPSDIRVARALGAPPMNLVPGHLVEAGVFIAGAVWPVSVQSPVGASVTLGVRAEDFSTTAAPSGLTLAGDVRLVEDNGADLHVHLRLATSEAEIVMRIQRSEARRWSIGTRVLAHAPSAAVRLFDEAGKRVPTAPRSLAACG